MRKIMVSGMEQHMVDNAYAVIMAKVGQRLTPKGSMAPPGMVMGADGTMKQEGEFLLAMPPHATGRLIGTGGASIKRIKEQAPQTRLRIDNDMCYIDCEDKQQLETCFNLCCSELEGHDYTIVRGPGGKSNVVVAPDKGKGKGRDKGKAPGGPDAPLAIEAQPMEPGFVGKGQPDFGKGPPDFGKGPPDWSKGGPDKGWDKGFDKGWDKGKGWGDKGWDKGKGYDDGKGWAPPDPWGKGKDPGKGPYGGPPGPPGPPMGPPGMMAPPGPPMGQPMMQQPMMQQPMMQQPMMQQPMM